MRWGEAAGTKAADERRTAAGTARLSLAGTAQAPSDARTFVSAVLARWGLSGPSVDDTTLLVSELVTNAVVHAGTAVRLECRQEGAALVVEVADQHPTRAVETVGGEDDAHRAAGRGGHGHEGHQGHGLRLVAALADEWGVSYRRDGKTVWFRLRRA
ncbi:MAG: ATP-binding protein, partial [Streptomyces sp.]